MLILGDGARWPHPRGNLNRESKLPHLLMEAILMFVDNVALDGGTQPLFGYFITIYSFVYN